MTTVVVSGTVSGYAVVAPITLLSITAAGYVTGNGVFGGAAGAYTIANAGRIEGTAQGVYLRDGGVVTNGANTDESAFIQGGSDGVHMSAVAGVVTNYGTIISTYIGDNFILAGVYTIGGTVTNGSLLDTVARIEGPYAGIASEQMSGATTIANFGTVQGVAMGVYTRGAGAVTNGAATATSALIQGSRAGVFVGAVSTIKNFGTLEGLSGAGAYLREGGTVDNGDAGDRTALVEGYKGVDATTAGGGTVANFGTILGVGASFRDEGVYLGDGGSVTNGGANDHSALITGYGGVTVFTLPGSVANFGTIAAASSAAGAANYGVSLYDGGTLANGAVNDRTALVRGYGGFKTDGAGSSVNFGTIAATGGAGSYGAELNGGAILTNGSANDGAALIEGYVGVRLLGSDTLTNFGTIIGVGGVALQFDNPGQELVVEAGSVIEGGVNLDSGALALGAGVGTIAAAPGASLTVSGDVPITTIQNVGDLVVGVGAAFTIAGPLGFSAGQTVDLLGALSTASMFTSAGALVVTGALGGTGTLALAGGDAVFGPGATLTIADVRQSGAATAAMVALTALDYAGVWTQTAGTISVGAGDRVNFSGKSDSFAGTLAGGGVVGFVGGADTLAGACLSASSVVINGATVTLSGAIDNTTTVSVTTPKLIVAAAGATLSGAGAIDLTNLATNAIVGAKAAATLTNVNNRIVGAGTIGGGAMILVNEAGGVINGDLATALTLNTGASVITNAGSIDNSGAGGTTIVSAIDNTGKMIAVAGTLAVEGAISGTGTGQVNAGTLKTASTFVQNVVFVAGSTGTLELAHGRAYSGTISGFSTTGKTFLDLDDITFTAGATKASYVGTATSGILTVTSGAQVARVHFAGNYTGATWTLSAGPGGGTKIADPAAGATATASSSAHMTPPILPTHTFIQTMAGLGVRGLAAASPGADVWRTPTPMLAKPGTQAA
jgi:hypothetical protein